MVRKGIDVSAWQGIIDWEAVKNSGVEFAILRAGTGRNNLDKTFKRNAEECNRLGIPWGAYWFSYALNEAMAKDEATYMVNIVKPYGPTLPLYYDLEYDTRAYAAKNGVNIDKAKASAFAVVFLETVRDYGYTPGLYFNLDYYRNYFTPDVVEAYEVWYAQYSNTCAKADIADIWQHSSIGRVPGINGNVDMNKMYKDYLLTAPIKKEPLKPIVTVSTLFGNVDLSDVYDYDYYIKNNPDVHKAFGDDKEAVFNHFKEFGMNEQRVAHPDFNVKRYKQYTDLTMAFGDCMPLYYYHYCLFGKKEGRELV